MFWNTNSQAKFLFSHSPDGFVFGEYHRKYVQKPANIDGNILVVGESSSGKTTCIAIPTLKYWAGQVFVIDINGELIGKVANVRGIDNIKVFNPTDRHAYGYDPFYMLNHTDDISSEARQIAMSVCPLPPDTKDPFWIKSAQNLLTGLVLFYHGLGFDFAGAMLQIKSEPIRRQLDTIMTTEGLQTVKAHLSEFSGMDDKTLSGVFAEVSNHITVFATNPDLQRALSGAGACITPADLENGKDIFCCIPEHKLDQWQPLLALIIRQSLAYVDQRQGRNHPPILFLLDDFHRLGRINQIALNICTMRGTNVTIAIFVQHINQLEKLYGSANKTVMVDCCFYSAHLSQSNEIDLCSPVGNFLIDKISDEA